MEKDNIIFISQKHEDFYYEKLKKYVNRTYIIKHCAIVLASVRIPESILIVFMILKQGM